MSEAAEQIQETPAATPPTQEAPPADESKSDSPPTFEQARDRLLARIAERSESDADGGDQEEASDAGSEVDSSAETETKTDTDADAKAKEPEAEPEKPKKKRNARYRDSIREAAAARHAEKKAHEEAASKQSELQAQLLEREQELQQLRKIQDQRKLAIEAGDIDEAVRLSGLADNVAELTKKKLGLNKQAATGGDPETRKLLEEQARELRELKEKWASVEQEKQAAAERARLEQEQARLLDQIKADLAESELDAVVGKGDAPGYKDHDGFRQHVLYLAQNYDATAEEIEAAAVETFDSSLEGLLKARLGVDLKRVEELLSGTATGNGEAGNSSHDKGQKSAAGKRNSRGSAGLPGQPSASAERRSGRSGTSIPTQSAETSARPKIDPDLPEHDRFEAFLKAKLGPRR